MPKLENNFHCIDYLNDVYGLSRSGNEIIQKMYPTSTQFLKYEQNQH